MAGNVYYGAHSAIQDGANVSILMVGDSWFWYPFGNLALGLGAKLPNQVFLVVGRSGSEASEWKDKYRKDIDFAFKLYAKNSQALMLSGGGNDIAGMNDFLRLLQDDCSNAKSVADCYRIAEPDTTLSMIDGAYRTLITKFRGHEPTAPVIVHQYDYAWPTGKGVFGPADWLKVPMDRAKVPKKLQRPLFRDLIDRLLALELAMAAEPHLNVHVTRTAGKLPEDASAWANELHPTPAGFKLLVKEAFMPVCKSLGIS